MLVNLKEILEFTKDKKTAIGSFNTPNFESVKAVITAAEELNRPVIIMHAQIHEEMGICTIEEIGKIMLFMADKAKVPVCVHLDHGTDLNYIKRGLDVGFTSVMYDGSELAPEQNYINTLIARELSNHYHASLEAEVGSMGAREGGGKGGESIYTDPDDAMKFARETGIDALACAFGTAHGIYAKEPKLDFPRLAKINELVDVPLVMHGGSGIKKQDYEKAMDCGIKKINYYSYMAKLGGQEVAKIAYKSAYHDIAVVGMKAMHDNAKAAINFFNYKG